MKRKIKATKIETDKSIFLMSPGTCNIAKRKEDRTSETTIEFDCFFKDLYMKNLKSNSSKTGPEITRAKI